jgi:hypothetical protein
MVEVAGIEPASEDRQQKASTCLAADLGVRFRPRPAAGLERLLAQCVSPAAAEHQRQGQPAIVVPSPAQASEEGRHCLIKQQVPVVRWQLCFPDLTSSRSSACHLCLMIPVEACHPLFNDYISVFSYPPTLVAPGRALFPGGAIFFRFLTRAPRRGALRDF